MKANKTVRHRSTKVYESFHDYFEMVPADTEALKNEVYRLRYRVYCLETQFENPDKFPDGREMDEYDARSDHYLIRHRQTGLYAATARLILPDPHDPSHIFPMEHHSRLQRRKFLETIPRNQIAEVSRFCVSPDFKRRRGETGTQAGLDHCNLPTDSSPGVVDRRMFPHIMVALIACVVRMTVRNGITHLYCFMETPLIRLCGQLGIQFTRVGPRSNYHGERQPSTIQVPEDLEPLRENNRHIWNQLTDNGNFWRYESVERSPTFCPHYLVASNSYMYMDQPTVR